MTAELVRVEVSCRYCGCEAIEGEDICRACFDYYDMSEPDYDDIDDGFYPSAVDL